MWYYTYRFTCIFTINAGDLESIEAKVKSVGLSSRKRRLKPVFLTGKQFLLVNTGAVIASGIYFFL